MKNNEKEFSGLIDDIIKNGYLYDTKEKNDKHILCYVEIAIKVSKDVPIVYRLLDGEIKFIEVDPDLWSEDLVMRVKDKIKELVKEKEADDKCKAQESVIKSIKEFSNEMTVNDRKLEEGIVQNKVTQEKKKKYINKMFVGICKILYTIGEFSYEITIGSFSNLVCPAVDDIKNWIDKQSHIRIHIDRLERERRRF